MKKIVVCTMAILLWCMATVRSQVKHDQMKAKTNRILSPRKGYSEVNGIKMYYEIYGKGHPLVLLHGGGSTIQTTFGRVMPMLALHRQLICVELQAHGRTGDRNTPISFEQDADDVAVLMKNLGIAKGDIFGFSNGGMTAIQMAIRHPEISGKIIAASVLLKRDGTFPQFWEFMKNATFAQMPQPYKDAFMAVNPDSSKLMNMNLKCEARMNNFKDFPDEQLKAIKSQVMFINGNEDVALPEHIVAMSRLVPQSKLVIVPGGHGEYIGEITTLKPGYKNTDFIVPIIENFLDK
ncbi:alpha/beta fold hydrolase [Pedobacter montanisoli]|uniref:Alpha/beta hydrolase n=1 Tax=Pedobacter montanisoli TaxID=2923277 RepID=A0ABS9ZRC0_9SPHI|nr:alpha/beta hydrolase [Pedobacter montanisoli]MCJ0741131.1 alpha/beta hydrolase [Pedobacter montanisoli]